MSAAAYQHLHQQFAYAPYVGGAGPSPQQSIACINALVAALTFVGFTCQVRHDEVLDDLVVACNRKLFCYDRWGFSSSDGELDNVDLATVVAYAKGEL